MLGKQIAVVAGAMAVAFGVAACSPTVDEPLTAEQAGFLLASLDKPTSLAKFSLESPGDFQDAYGDQEDVVQTFENASPECAAVSDLEELTRFAPGGNDYRKFLPSKLRGFDTMTGVEFGFRTPEGADVSSYASVGVAVLTFGSTEEAVEYTSTIRTNVEPCFDFVEEAGEGNTSLTRSLDLMRFTEAEDGPPNFSYETVYSVAFSGSGIDVSVFRDEISSVRHHGPNVVVIHAARDDEAGAELGITNDDLQDGIESIFLQIDELILEVLNTDDFSGSEFNSTDFSGSDDEVINSESASTLPISSQPRSVTLDPTADKDESSSYGCWEWGRVNGLFTAGGTDSFTYLDCVDNPGKELFVRTWDAELLTSTNDIPVAIDNVSQLDLVAISPDGDRIAFDDNATEDCVIVDTASGKELARYERGSVMCFSTFSPDGEHFYSNQTGVIREWNLTLGTEERTFRVGESPRTVFATDSFLIVGSGYGWGTDSNEPPNLISVVDLKTGQTVKVLETADYPEDFSSGSDGSQVFFIAGGALSESLWMLDLETMTANSIAEPTWTNPTDTAVSPDGDLLAIADGPDRGVLIFDVGSGQVVQTLTPDGSNYVSFSDDGKRLYVAGLNRLTVFDISS